MLGIVLGAISISALLVTILKMKQIRMTESEKTPIEPPTPRTGFWAHSEQKIAETVESESAKQKTASDLNEMNGPLSDSTEDDAPGLEGKSSRLSS